MIGKYEDEDFVTKLTTDEQGEYFSSLVKEISHDEFVKLIDHINDVRIKVIRKHYDEGAYPDIDMRSHIF